MNCNGKKEQRMDMTGDVYKRQDDDSALDDIKDALDNLTDAATQLVDGTSDLYEDVYKRQNRGCLRVVI